MIGTTRDIREARERSSVACVEITFVDDLTDTKLISDAERMEKVATEALREAAS
jgi:hypothetical protein